MKIYEALKGWLNIHNPFVYKSIMYGGRNWWVRVWRRRTDGDCPGPYLSTADNGNDFVS